ncbi:MAG: restriction endonuclease subunit S [Bacteroidales bacterium]|nr:restriction endonuclease subunit S [Bacteroidales bacterium]
MQSNYKRLGDYIHPIEERNKDLREIPLMGLSINKVFIPSIANTIGTDMSTYRIIKREQFAYGPVTSRNGDKITIALFDDYDEALISQAYFPFKVNDKEKLLPEYLMMWFRRPEFDRYARFMSHGSAREIFSWEEMCNTLLPVPTITKQKEIVAEYNTIQNRIKLNEKLIQKLEETAQAVYREWFVEGIGENFEKIKLNELVQTQYGYTETASTEIIGPKFLRITDIAQNQIDWTNVPYCKISESDFEKYKLKPGDIVVARTGATAGYGKRLHKHFPDCVFASFLVRLIPNELKWNLFLGLTVDSQAYREFILSNAEGSAQPQANATLLTSYEIDKPDESKILEFNSIIEPFFDLIENKQQENQKLSELKDLLLSKLATVNN